MVRVYEVRFVASVHGTDRVFVVATGRDEAQRTAADRFPEIGIREVVILTNDRVPVLVSKAILDKGPPSLVDAG